MNIKEAKEQIKNAMIAYFTKDETGNYSIPIEKQRPVFLMGPPGIGKTAIMEQIASEMKVGLLTYSMTHHTRQSAIGLPFIVHKTYNGEEFDVSEYTMSEIISSIYDMMEKTGVKEGILFLDEINCVSETLSPLMLQFLQYKIFGRHRVPEGWIVVTAGNPPEYNDSVRDFDIVTWDRLKRIDVEPDFNVWKEYSYIAGIHSSIITYLEVKKDDFYRIESTVKGKRFVTARGWEDLSQMIFLYEKNNIPVDIKLIGQYIQHDKIALSFATYYDLYIKYKSSYQIEDIVNGKASEEIRNRARNAKFDEKVVLIGLLLEKLSKDSMSVNDGEKIKNDLMRASIAFKANIMRKMTVTDAMIALIDSYKNVLKLGKIASNMSKDEIRTKGLLIIELEKMLKNIDNNDGINAVKNMQSEIKIFAESNNKKITIVGSEFSNTFKFCEDVFPEGQEILLLITEMTLNPNIVRYIMNYGCDEYFKHNKDLMVYDKQKQIMKAIDEIGDLDDINQIIE